MAWESIKSNKMRSFLTMLGIIIGVTALVTLVSLVNGATGAITSQVESLGNDMLMVTVMDDKSAPLRLENLPKLGVVMKRAQYFLTANGRMADGLRFTQDSLLRNLIAVEQSLLPQPEMRQLSLFDDAV